MENATNGFANQSVKKALEGVLELAEQAQKEPERIEDAIQKLSEIHELFFKKTPVNEVLGVNVLEIIKDMVEDYHRHHHLIGRVTSLTKNIISQLSESPKTASSPLPTKYNHKIGGSTEELEMVLVEQVIPQQSNIYIELPHFYITKSLVTQQQYDAILQTNRTTSLRKKLITNISWIKAFEVSQNLTNNSNVGHWCLPTKKQWIRALQIHQEFRDTKFGEWCANLYHNEEMHHQNSKQDVELNSERLIMKYKGTIHNTNPFESVGKIAQYCSNDVGFRLVLFPNEFFLS